MGGGMDEVDHQVLWDAVQKDLPVLLVTIEEMLKESNPDEKASV